MEAYEIVMATRDAAPTRAELPGAALPQPCRFCGAPLTRLVLDLGMSPLCERFLRADQLDDVEPFYPLRRPRLRRCWLVQLAEYVSPAEIFERVRLLLVVLGVAGWSTRSGTRER